MLSAYRAAQAAKTAHFTLSESLGTGTSGASGPTGAQEVSGSGELDLSAKSFQMTLHLPTATTLDVLESGGVLYVQVPPADAAKVPGGRPWVSIDLNKVSEAAAGKSLSQLSQLSAAVGGDPTQALSELSAVSDQVTRVGSAPVAGTPATEYRASVDLDKVAAKVGGKAAAAIHHEEQGLGSHTLPVAVWVGTDGRLRQLQEQVPLPAGATTGGSTGVGGGGSTSARRTASLTMTLSDFGTPVDVTPPPSGEVTDVTTQVLQAAGASTSSGG